MSLPTRMGVSVAMGFFVIALDIVFESLFPVVFNSGAGFGIAFFPQWFIIATSSALLLLIFFFYSQSIQERGSLFLWQTLLFFGGVSNLLDRIRFDGVKDYWKFVGFWSFNLPDLFLVLGIAGWVLISLFQHGKVKES